MPHLLCTDNDKHIHLHSITRRFLSDVQTDVHFVRVDSDSPIRKLAVTLIYQCKWCSNKALTCFSAAPFPMLQLNYSIDLQAIYLQQSTWVDNMYVRVAEVTAQSELQFKMLMAFIEKDLLPKNIAAGQLSGEIFRTSSNSCFVISRFTSKSQADKIMSIMKAELNEMKGTNKIKLIEGERILNLGQEVSSST